MFRMLLKKQLLRKMWSFVLTLPLLMGSVKGAILPANFEVDCSEVQCPSEVTQCPSDSAPRLPAPTLEQLYDPEELGEIVELNLDKHKASQEFYDDNLQQHYDGEEFHPSDADLLFHTNFPIDSTVTELTQTPTTTNQPVISTRIKHLDAEAENELSRTKRHVNFVRLESDEGMPDDKRELLLNECCATITESRQQHSNADDCECKPCAAVPKCPPGEVAVELHKASGAPGDCCTKYACAAKQQCGNADAKPYWLNSCIRCSCHGAKGPELCHNNCPNDEPHALALEQDLLAEGQEQERSCYSSYLQQPMLHDSNWYEDNYCTECHCENGERDCVTSLCAPVACSNPVKLPGRCCPQCPVREGHKLNHSHNSTSDVSMSTEKTLQTVSSIAIQANVTTTTLTESVPTQMVYSTKAHTQTTGSELTTAYTKINVGHSSTEAIPTATQIDKNVAAVAYFYPFNITTLLEAQETVPTGTMTPPLRPLTREGTSYSSINSTYSETTEAMSTVALSNTTARKAFSESSTEQSSTIILHTHNPHTALSSSEVPRETVNKDAETTVRTESTPNESSSQQLHTNVTPAITPSTGNAKLGDYTDAGDTRTPAITPSTPNANLNEYTDAAMTRTFGPSTSSPYTSSVKQPPVTTWSPYSSSSRPQISTSGTGYWPTLSTSAPLPPEPQPTIYQPSVRTFFTRPEVHILGAGLFVALIAVCSLAIWKYFMPAGNARLTNHYKTVPSSEATSLSHSPTTSHSSVA